MKSSYLLWAIGAVSVAAFAMTERPASTSKSHTVRMQGGRFAPYELTIAPGDTVRFVLGSGGPHNVAFRETKGEAAVRLRARMTDQMSDLSGPLLVVPDDSYTIVFTDVPVGAYPYWCIPHLGMGMMGSITIK